MSAKITGVHPLAAQWPMIPEADLRRLADDIADRGLLYPIVVGSDGLILDGRNRHAACQIAGVEPEVTVYSGDDLAGYVLSVNNERRHLSTGQRAMATALTLAEAGKRKGGRWEYGSVPAESTGSGKSRDWSQRMQEAGLILDHTPDLAPQILDGSASLDAAYKQARDAAEHAKRRAELPADLGALVDSGELGLDDGLRRNALPADYAARVASDELTLNEAEHLSTRDARERQEAVDRNVNRVRNFLDGYDAAASLHRSPDRDAILDGLGEHDRDRFLRIEKERAWPTT